MEDIRTGWAPPIAVSVSEWADRYLYLSPEYAAEPGKWHTLPFQKGIFDAVSQPDVEQVVVKSCTQLVKTSLINAAIAWAIDVDPGPILVIQPRDADAKSFSKERIAPMLRDTPQLAGKVAESKSRTSDNTIEEKWFKGGMLAITSAGSPGNLARRAIRYLFCDEEDKWALSAGVEGKPFSLAMKRTATFRHRRKVIRCCSPTRSGSAIDLAYEDSDRRQFYIPCPSCGHHQSLVGKFFSNVIWDNTLASREERAASARYRCESCDALWTDAERHAAVNRGEWRATAQFSGVAGFWISELYSPWKSLRDIVLDFLTKKDNPVDYITFHNTSLAENWVDKGECPEWERLLDYREEYPVGSVPAPALFLTAGVDIQKDRIEVEIVGWGRNFESWSIEYAILEGDTSEPNVWRQLDELLMKTYPHASGVDLPISRVFVDSGGITNEVYRWARTQPPQKIALIKGDDKSDLLVGQPSAVEVTLNGKKVKTGLHIRRVKVSSFKQEFYSWLSKRRPTDEEREQGQKFPVGYCHFPNGRNYGDEHFRQLCAEQLVAVRNPRTGMIRHVWQKVNANARNEALDARIYARAAAWDFGLDRAVEAQWKRLEAQLGAQLQSKQKDVDSAPPSEVATTGGSTVPSSGAQSNQGIPAYQEPPVQTPSDRRESNWIRRGDWLGKHR